MANIIVTKVYDHDCDICNHMEKHDRATFESFPEIGYQKVTLEEVIAHDNNRTKMRIYQCLERHCLNSDYSIDLPVYVFLEKDGKYLGHLQGALAIPELRDGVKSLLDTTDNSSE
jgi:hypothetical protein